MSRRLFCHEEELLRRFSQCEFDTPVAWPHSVLTDDMWGGQEHYSKQDNCWFNVNFRSSFSTSPFPQKSVSQVAQIHPAYLTPAVFVVSDETSGEIHSIELLNGESVDRKDYTTSIALINKCAKNDFEDFNFDYTFSWWRIFAMFDRLLFLVSKRDFESSCRARRKHSTVPNSMHGDCFVLYEDVEPIGFEGWLEYPTGFGTDADI